MQRSTDRRADGTGSELPSSKRIASVRRGVSVRRVLAIGLVLSTVASVSVGSAAAGGVGSAPGAGDDPAESNDAYSLVQDGRCYDLTAVSGNESVMEFYDYRTPFEDNPYANATGSSYSSEGTEDLQRPDSSVLFLYRDRPTDNLSLVFVHGSIDDASVGGSASFDVTGLPEDGTWAVKDDEYDGDSNYDVWTETRTATRVDWTWGGGRTDGGAYEGLGDEFNVSVEPGFNEEAELYGEHYDGTVRNWTALSNVSGEEASNASGDGKAIDRVELNRSQPITVAAGTCDEDRAPGTAGGDEHRDTGDDVRDGDGDRSSDDESADHDDSGDRADDGHGTEADGGDDASGPSTDDGDSDGEYGDGDDGDGGDGNERDGDDYRDEDDATDDRDRDGSDVDDGGPPGRGPPAGDPPGRGPPDGVPPRGGR